VEVLAHVPGPEIAVVLVAMQNDAHPRVREAADAALASRTAKPSAPPIRETEPARP
jgi:hypothetical protein